MLLTLSELLLSLQFALVAFTVSEILMDAGNILYPYRALLYRLEATGKVGAWLAKPLGQCAVCLAGQFALWGYLPAFCSLSVGVVRWASFVALCVLWAAVAGLVWRRVNP